MASKLEHPVFKKIVYYSEHLEEEFNKITSSFLIKSDFESSNKSDAPIGILYSRYTVYHYENCILLIDVHKLLCGKIRLKEILISSVSINNISFVID